MMYKAFLTLHVTGITIMAGTTFIDFIVYRQFWKSFVVDPIGGLAFERIADRLQRFLGIGMLLIILSGIGMMYYMHQVWGQQIWFRIKMGLLLLIIANGLALRRRTGTKIKLLVTDFAVPDTIKLSRLKFTLTIIQSIQISLFIIIFILSVFKFN